MNTHTSQGDPRSPKFYPHLTLGDVIGLTSRESSALAHAADELRREGKLEAALQVWSAILSCDPYAARSWREVAQLQQRLGHHAEAIAAYEMLARVADREAEPTYREALSCIAIGDRETARLLFEEAIALTSGFPQPWIAHAQRNLENIR